MNWAERAFGPAEEIYRQEVLRDTWGHLAPTKGREYPGRIVFSFGVFDSGDLNPVVLVCDFGDLDSSPWFYDALQGFLDRYTPGEAGRVYEWTGTFRNYRFKGSRPRLICDTNAKGKGKTL